MPSDGSNRASEGEQLWSPDPPIPSAGEVFSTIPAATDNQLLKFANLQVVWYTSAISTIVPTIDYLQRLQHGLVGSFVQDEKVNDNDLANLLTKCQLFLSNKSRRKFSGGMLNIKPSDVRVSQPTAAA